MIALVELYVSYIATYLFWNHIQENTSNKNAGTTYWILE